MMMMMMMIIILSCIRCIEISFGYYRIESETFCYFQIFEISISCSLYVKILLGFVISHSVAVKSSSIFLL